MPDGRGGSGVAVRSGASQTQPCRSSTAHGIAQVGARRRGARARRATGCRRSGPRRRTASRAPGTAAGRRPPSRAASGTSRCGQRAGKALTSPPGRSRTTTYASPPAPTGTGVVPTSAARATGNQPVGGASGVGHEPLQRRPVPRRYADRAFSRHRPGQRSVRTGSPDGDEAEIVGERAAGEGSLTAVTAPRARCTGGAPPSFCTIRRARSSPKS